MKNKMKQKTNTIIQKPILVLNDQTKFYLATVELNDDEPSDLFFIMSLFLPVKDSIIYAKPSTEIMTFNDAESADAYRQTLSHYCDVNIKSDIAKSVEKAIEDFKKHTAQYNTCENIR